MNIFRAILATTTLSLVFLSGLLLFPANASATVAAKQSACEGVLMTGGDCSFDSSSSIDNTIRTVIYIFSWIVGIVSVIMIIVGGLKYITSSGDSNNVNSAKNTILYAVIGLIVVAMAQVIVKFVLKQVD